MSKNSPEKSNQIFKDEALLMAKSIQRPNQTKEQTRLITQGIEKGIALYKKQQAEKHRAFDKQKKKKDNVISHKPTDLQDIVSVKTQSVIVALYSAGGVFLMMALFTLTAVLFGTDTYFSNPRITVGLLIVSSVLFSGLAIWLLKLALFSQSK